jgi:hypothetical protein
MVKRMKQDEDDQDDRDEDGQENRDEDGIREGVVA